MRTTAERLPRELATLIRPALPPLAEEIVHTIRATIPEYAKPLDGCYGQAIRLGVNQALTQFVDRIADPDRPPADQSRAEFAEMYRQLGRLEASEGRSLDSLQKAYRLGTRVAWRHLIRFRQRSGLPTNMMWTLGEATLAYADELIALSVEGYADMQARSTQGRVRRRKRLVRLLLSEEDRDRAEAVELAPVARWPLPAQLCVVLLDRVSGSVDSVPDLPDDMLADVQGGQACVLVPDPDATDWWARCAAKLTDWRVVIGPTVSLADSAKSFKHAQIALDLVRRNVIDGARPVRCVDHLSTLWLLADEFLVEQLIRKRLAPLAPLTDKQHKRLGETLLAWLETRGGAPEIAARLRVHPQTVRYRMRQVERLFGDQLRCPDARFELEVALRAAALTETPASPQEVEEAG